MNDATKLLSIWDVDEAGQSVPMSFSQLCARLENENAEQESIRYFDRWSSEGLIRANIYGQFLLTEQGLRLRKDLPSRPVRVQELRPNVGSEHAWGRFRRLLGYYIDCVTQQERAGIKLYEKNYRKQYLSPTLPFRWLKPLLGEESRRQELRVAINTIHDQVARLHLLSRREHDEPIYLAYPIQMFQSPEGERILAPIGMIPVEITQSRSSEMSLVLQMDAFSINPSWLEHRFSDKRKTTELINLLHQSHAEEGDAFHSCIDAYHVLGIIEKYAHNPKGCQLDPDALTVRFSKEELEGEKSVLLNAALLFVGPELIYSRTLRKELRFLRDHASSEQLDQTSLAYVFRDPPMQASAGDEYPYPFIASNDEQSQAIEAALNQATSRVTGPPGTGKSQVAVNMIANHVLRDKSVLFTSKNHRAVHAIAERCATLLERDDPAFIQFCSSDDGSVRRPWFEQDLEAIISKAREGFSELEGISVSKIRQASKILREAEARMERRQACCTKLALHHHQLELAEQELQLALEEDEDAEILLSPEEPQQLKQLLAGLMDEPTLSLNPAKLLRWFCWKYGGRERHELALLNLRERFTELLEFCHSTEQVRERLSLVVQAQEHYLSCKQEYERSVAELQKLPDIQGLKQRVLKQQQVMSQHLKPALRHQLKSRIIQVSGDEKMKKKLLNSLRFLKAAQQVFVFALKGKRAKLDAEIAFKDFTQYCPAWAATMLSLSSASPCLPALFDLVIIDEASQCEIAPMIPALYRAKRVSLIGDPQQFPPIVTLPNHAYLRAKHHLDMLHEHRFDYEYSTCYNALEQSPIMIRQHYRCHPDIAAYFNGEFYDNKLELCTDRKARELRIPRAAGITQAVTWVDIRNSYEAELAALQDLVERIVNSGYEGSVGIITPLRAHAADIEKRVGRKLRQLKSGDYRISTVNSYQGGEMDVIILAVGYSTQLQRGQKWYIADSSHRYIFNVAVSRARSCLILLGDRQACAQSQVSALISLAEISAPKEQGLSFDSPWEKRLYEALKQAGITTTPQRRLGSRRLDLALEEGELKLDIEVDGIHYHSDQYGERKPQDLLRDLEVEAQGWQVCRFWVYELRQDMGACVAKVQGYMNS